MIGRENRYHIGIYGPTNAGKSTLANRLIGQTVSIVSPIPGTTTDPVRKGVELPGVGPCQIIDTAGLDDDSPLGKDRAKATLRTLYQVDLALLVEGPERTNSRAVEEFIQLASRAEVPLLHVVNSRDDSPTLATPQSPGEEAPIRINALSGLGVEVLLTRIAAWAKEQKSLPSLFEGLLSPGDQLALVVPIDAGAPQGRLILPQVQALRAALDLHAIPTLTRPEELPKTLDSNRGIKLVVTDSQLFREVNAMVPPHIALTSFSLLLARQKGAFTLYLEGTPRISQLKPGDRALIVEGCSHHASCDDIGRVKIPCLLARMAGGTIDAHFVNGNDSLPHDLTGYSIALLCGGCMNTPRQIQGRALLLAEAGVPVTNYGMALAYMQGIYQRATMPFREL